MGIYTCQPRNRGDCPSRGLLAAHAFAAESLTALQREQVVDHLAVCPVCAEAYLSLCQLEEQLIADTPGAGAAALSGEPAISDEQIIERLWKDVAAEEIVTGSRRTHWPLQRRAIVAAAASLLLALGLAAWWVASHGSRGGSPAAVLVVGPGAASRTDLSREAVWAESPGMLANPLFDPDKLDYEKWREEHREWFATIFPWIFQAETVLKARGIQTDYIELLVVSGDIWQFRFDPEGPVDQLLAAYTRTAMERLASHYHIPVELLNVTGHSTAASVSRYSFTVAVQRWMTSLTSARDAGSTQRTALLTSSLPAARYIVYTREAACLWGHRRLAEAGRTAASHDGVLDAMSTAAAYKPQELLRDIARLRRATRIIELLLIAEANRGARDPLPNCSGSESLWQDLARDIGTIGVWEASGYETPAAAN